MGSEIPRVRQVTSWVINQFSQYVPGLILNKMDNTDKLMQTMVLHIEKDKPRIKNFCACTIASLFEHQKTLQIKQHMVLNNYYKDVMTKIVDNFKDEDVIKYGILHGLSDSLNTCVEDCDYENL